MLNEQQLRDALVNQPPEGAEIDGFFKVEDAHGRIRMGAITKTSMNGDDEGWYAEVSNFQIDHDYCDPCEHTAGLYRFFCEVDFAYTTVNDFYLSASVDARNALDAVHEPRS